MELNLKNIKVSFSDKLAKHNSLYSKDKIDPETLAQSRLDIIQQAKKEIENKSSAVAFSWYGTCFVKGDEGFPIDIDAGIKLLNEAVMMRDITADNLLGDIYSGMLNTVSPEMFDFDRAIKHYNKSAKENSGYANFRLAEIYSGYPPEYKDIRKALDNIDAATERGDYDGMALKAMWMYNGEFLNKDLDKILDLLTQVLDNTQNTFEYDLARSRALYLMGYIIFYGDVEEANEEEGAAMIEEAARMGDYSAIQWLEAYDAYKSNPSHDYS